MKVRRKMEEERIETVTTQSSNNQASSKREATGSQTVGYVVYFLLGVLEVLLAFRFVLKLLGASTTSGFVNFIYGLSSIFIYPFEQIFRSGVGEGIETKAVLESSTLIAMVVYAVIAWGVVKLIKIMSGEKQE
jgi:hypothetical protein